MLTVTLACSVTGVKDVVVDVVGGVVSFVVSGKTKQFSSNR